MFNFLNGGLLEHSSVLSSMDECLERVATDLQIYGLPPATELRLKNFLGKLKWLSAQVYAYYDLHKMVISLTCMIQNHLFASSLQSRALRDTTSVDSDSDSDENIRKL